MFPENPRRNKIDLFIFCHFDLWLGIQINHQEFWPMSFR